jgi:hypothetical protein
MVPAPGIIVAATWSAAVCAVPIVLAQASPLESLVTIVRPVLPYPPADDTGDLPQGNSAESRWFVIWPTADDPRVVVRANPLHPEVQKSVADADARIQEAVIASERKAQASYERAMEELRRTGTTSAPIDQIALDDEGVAGERIDAQLELALEVDASPRSFDIATSAAPVVTQLTPGIWAVQIRENSYRDTTPDGMRQRFRPAEARVYVGLSAPPAVTHAGDDRFSVAIPRAERSFGVSIRGNSQLLEEVLLKADWGRFLR